MSSFWVVFSFLRLDTHGVVRVASVFRGFALLSSFSHWYGDHVQSILNDSLSPAPGLVLALSERATENNLQTDPGDIAKIREAVKENKEACLCLLNYKKDGSTFHNQFFLTPLFDEAGTLAYFLGIQVQVKTASDGQEPENPGWIYTMGLHA
ncbi:unnamed protein product [Ectocarpus sp. 12 AP-2014]